MKTHVTNLTIGENPSVLFQSRYGRNPSLENCTAFTRIGETPYKYFLLGPTTSRKKQTAASDLFGTRVAGWIHNSLDTACQTQFLVPIESLRCPL